MLAVFGGLPATGKSTLAARVAEELGGLYLRIDTIEQAMKSSGQTVSGPEGYLVACALAEDNLRQGQLVFVDAVNPLELTRDYWRVLAKHLDVLLIEIHVTCSDLAEHRNRVETRIPDIPGHKLPDWQQVQDRQFEPWDGATIVDTVKKSVTESVDEIKSHLSRRGLCKLGGVSSNCHP